VCPAGQRVLGTGAKTSDLSGNVVLQVARPSASGDIARAQAHEDADGYSGGWSVTAYAVCAPPPPGYEVVFGRSSAAQSESLKYAVAACPAGKQLHSSGAAITDVAPGHVSLKSVFPNLAQGHALGVAVENTATNLNWDFIVASAVCAY
jgi:hypothetical protein